MALYPGLIRERLRKVFSFQMSPCATHNSVADNPLPATYWLSGPDVGYHTSSHGCDSGFTCQLPWSLLSSGMWRRVLWINVSQEIHEDGNRRFLRNICIKFTANYTTPHLRRQSPSFATVISCRHLAKPCLRNTLHSKPLSILVLYFSKCPLHLQRLSMYLS